MASNDDHFQAGSSDKSSFHPAADANMSGTMEDQEDAEDTTDLEIRHLNLNPVVQLDAAECHVSEYDEEEEDDDDEDYVEEICEVEKQQLQQITNFVDAAYKRVDMTRSINVSGVEPSNSTSPVSEVELTDGVGLSSHPRPKTYTALTNIAHEGPSPYSNAVTQQSRPVSTQLSAGDSQLTHPSDFCSTSAEDGELLLETLKGMPDSLEKALTINQTLQKRFMKNIERLEECLRQNLRKQLELLDHDEEMRVNSEEEKLVRESDSRYFLRITSFCRPYFKSKSGMPAPMNDDAKKRTSEGYIDMYQTRARPWRPSDNKKLREVAVEEARQTQIINLQRREKAVLRELRKQSADQNSAELQQQLLEIADQLSNMQQCKLQDVPLPPGLGLDWIKIAAQASDGHRTTDECQYMWDTVISPAICQDRFSEQDDIAIQTAVKQRGNRKPDWEKIAKSLSQPRSQFQVFKRYQSFIAPVMKPVKWTKESLQRLFVLIDTHKVGDYIPWSQIHLQMPGFTRAQLQAKWKYSNPNKRKGAFTALEDDLFLKGLYKFGLKFDQMSKLKQQRSKQQLKDRFRRIYVRNFLIDWTPEMDQELMELTGTENTRLDPSFWRSFASEESFHSAGVDGPCLRLRFLRLKYWKEEVAKLNTIPPRLFPVSLTTNPEEVQELLNHFQQAEMADCISVLEKINAGVTIARVIEELSAKQRRVHQQHDEHRNRLNKQSRDKTAKALRLNHLHIHHMHKHAINADIGESPIDRRAINSRPCKTLTWPEQLLYDFFLPSTRVRPSPVNFSRDTGAVEALRLSLAAMQVRPLPVQLSELEVLSRLNVSQSEMDLVNKMVGQHTCVEHRQEASPSAPGPPCLWCLGVAVPECIPLLPPSSITISALESLMLHKNTLKVVADGKFVLHNVSGTEVRSLGERAKKNIEKVDTPNDYEIGNLPRPNSIGKIHITSVMPKVVTKQVRRKTVKRPVGLQRKKYICPGIVKRKPPKWTVRSIIDIYRSYKSGKGRPGYKPPVKQIKAICPEAAEIDAVDPAPISTAGEEATPSQLPHVSSATAFLANDKFRHETPTASTSQEFEEDTAYSDDEYATSEDIHEPLSAEEQRALQETDNLLLHRFLSLFLWPAAMTFVRPSPAQEQQVDELYYETTDRKVTVAQSESSGSKDIKGAAKRLLEKVAQNNPKPQGQKRRRGAAGAVVAKRNRPVRVPTRCSTRQAKKKDISSE